MHTRYNEYQNILISINGCIINREIIYTIGNIFYSKFVYCIVWVNKMLVTERLINKNQ